jgi:hypothetical protein
LRILAWTRSLYGADASLNKNGGRTEYPCEDTSTEEPVIVTAVAGGGEGIEPFIPVTKEPVSLGRGNCGSGVISKSLSPLTGTKGSNPAPPAERVCCEPGSLDQVPLAALAIALLASFAHSSARTRQCRGAHPGSDDGHPLPQGHDRRGQYFFAKPGPPMDPSSCCCTDFRPHRPRREQVAAHRL